MFKNALQGKRIEIDGIGWEVAVRDHYSMGTYHVIRLDLVGPRTYPLILRIRSESLMRQGGDDWILEGLRTHLNVPFAFERGNLWL